MCAIKHVAYPEFLKLKFNHFDVKLDNIRELSNILFIFPDETSSNFEGNTILLFSLIRSTGSIDIRISCLSNKDVSILNWYYGYLLNFTSCHCSDISMKLQSASILRIGKNMLRFFALTQLL
jgi:hypothetical protein